MNIRFVCSWFLNWIKKRKLKIFLLFFGIVDYWSRKLAMFFPQFGDTAPPRIVLVKKCEKQRVWNSTKNECKSIGEKNSIKNSLNQTSDVEMILSPLVAKSSIGTVEFQSQNMHLNENEFNHIPFSSTVHIEPYIETKCKQTKSNNKYCNNNTDMAYTQIGNINSKKAAAICTY